MTRRKSSRRGHRGHRAKHTRVRSRRTKHTRRRHTRHTRRVRRSRRGGDGSIGTPYSAYRMMPFGPNQTLDGRYFSSPNQSGGSPCTGGTLQPSGNMINASCKNGQMATTLVTGGRA